MQKGSPKVIVGGTIFEKEFVIKSEHFVIEIGKKLPSKIKRAFNADDV
jgi:hypothetical protein